MYIYIEVAAFLGLNRRLYLLIHNQSDRRKERAGGGGAEHCKNQARGRILAVQQPPGSPARRLVVK
jgi:hypothetical protein